MASRHQKDDIRIVLFGEAQWIKTVGNVVGVNVIFTCWCLWGICWTSLWIWNTPSLHPICGSKIGHEGTSYCMYISLKYLYTSSLSILPLLSKQPKLYLYKILRILPLVLLKISYSFGGNWTSCSTLLMAVNCVYTSDKHRCSFFLLFYTTLLAVCW